MTREEAIEVFNKPAKHIGLYNGELTYSAELVRAFEMAIEALQTQLKESQENFNKDSETESMLKADLISRQNCKYRHENGNCLAVGGFCLSVDDEHCQYEA